MRRSIAPAIGVAAGFGIAAVAARRSRSQRDDFYEAPAAGAEAWEDGGTRVTLPITYHRSEQVISFHPVSLEAARAALPTDALHPVRLPDGRALLAVSAARYLEGTAPGEDARDLRYGEVMVAVLVTRAPSAPLVPIVRALLPGIGAPTFGAFLLYVAMTNRASRDTGRALGFPAFVGDLAFEDGIDERRLDLSDEGRQILQLRVASKGRITTDRRPMTMYSVLDDRLLETVCPCSGIAQQRLGPGSGRLELGDHPVADSLRELGLSPEALVSRSYLNLRMRIPSPRTGGTARPYAGYAGSDREWGAYTITYPDGSRIDMHAAGRDAGSSRVSAPTSRRPRSTVSVG